jgi:hypothetical protein
MPFQDLDVNPLLRFVGWIFDPTESYADSWAEDYLSQSANLHDLERRMRQLDAQRHIGPFGWNA